MHELRTGHRTVSEVASNWKILIENYNECLHCPTVHPELSQVAPAFGKGLVLEPGRHDWGVSIVNGGVGYTATGTTSIPVMPGLDDHQASSMYGATVYPNMFIDLTGTVVIATRMLPRGAAHTTIVTDYLFRPEVVDDPDFDPIGGRRLRRARREAGLRRLRARAARRVVAGVHARRVRGEGRLAAPVQQAVPRGTRRR